MGKTGVCWDDAAAESFLATMKNEVNHRYRFTTRVRAWFAVLQYIEVFSNRARFHSTLDYQTRAEALAAHLTQTTIAACTRRKMFTKLDAAQWSWAAFFRIA